MNPALTQIQHDSRAADLRTRAERHRVPRPSGRVARRDAAEVEAAQAAAAAPAFGRLFLGHGFFGREHGSHA